MKKLILALMVLVCAVSLASAAVGIDWYVVYGAYDSDAPNVTGDDNPLLDSYSVTWQLIYAGANNQADPINLSNSANGWVGGDDVVWGSRSIPLGGGDAGDGTSYNNWMLRETGDTTYVDMDWDTAGFVFQRVFQGAPQLGSWYYQTDLEALNTNYDPMAGAQIFTLDTFDAGFQPNQQIPEPATMSLLGLGALALAFRRRRS